MRNSGVVIMISDLFKKPILIFGCGNILWGDDGFGPAVIQRLKDYQVPDDVLAMDVGTSIRDILFDIVLSDEKPKKIYIIDAVEYPDRKPGEVFEIPVEGIPDKKTSDFSLHQFPTVNMLQELKEHSQIDIKIIVAQVESMPEEVTPGLSAVMVQAVDATCQRLVAEIGKGSG
jgi:coenzyme F420 hydrogenase subunit delta